MMIVILYGVNFKIFLLSIAVGEANQVAHNLTRRAKQHRQNCTWIDEPPNFILDLVINDVTILDE
jgi:hypothetical protein